MGQAFIITNLDKKQYIHPHDLGDGYKLLELCDSLTALSLLLANDTDHPWADAPRFGEWSGDRVMIVGEYSEEYDDVTSEFKRIGKRLADWIHDQ